MTPEETLLAALAGDPGDELAWLALADELEEDGQPLRGELVRLTRRLCRTAPDDPDSLRTTDERRLIALPQEHVDPLLAAESRRRLHRGQVRRIRRLPLADAHAELIAVVLARVHACDVIVSEATHAPAWHV